MLIDAVQNAKAPPQEFPVEYLHAATDNFSSTNKLGKGGFGSVYKASDSTSQIKFVVKWADLECVTEEKKATILQSFKCEIAVSPQCVCLYKQWLPQASPCPCCVIQGAEAVPTPQHCSIVWVCIWKAASLPCL